MDAVRDLEGKFALVTGGSRGIGLAAAEAFAAAGGHVAVSSRNAAEAEAVARGLHERTGIGTLGVACDVSDPDAVRHLFERIAAWCGGALDILACNAGYPFRRELWETPLHATPRDKLKSWYQDVFRTDTLGSLFCTYEALPLMIERRTGSIIYVSSTPALEGLQGSPYTVAKAGILGLMKDVACVYGRYNIRANALALGSIATQATLEQLDETSRRAFAEDAPLRRWGSPAEVAQAMLFLASGRSAFITGQTLVVDGGTVRW